MVVQERIRIDIFWFTCKKMSTVNTLNIITTNIILMKSKTFSFVMLFVSFIALVATASAACSSCGNSESNCPTCGNADNVVDNGECTVAITDFTASVDCSETPCTVSFAGSVNGDAAKVKYYLVNANGRVVCSKVATCGEDGCTATCTVFKPGTYTAVIKACGPDGCCVTKTQEVVIGNSEDDGSEVSDSSCGSCNSDNGRYHGWNHFREWRNFRGWHHFG